MKVLRFIGIDQNILDYCSGQEKFLYKAFNVLQLLLILIVGFSTYYLFEIIFKNTSTSIILALFWSFVFYNLYRFILMTTSGQKGVGIKERISLMIPNAFKIGVVGFFAVFISLPIELYMNKDYIEATIPSVLNNKIETVKAEIDEIYATQYQEIETKIVAMKTQLTELDTLIKQQEQKMKLSEAKEEQHQIFIYLNKLHAERALKAEKYLPVVVTLMAEQSAIENEKREDLNQYARIIKGSNLLLERFVLLLENRPLMGFFLAAFVVLLFLSPLFYKLYSLYKLNFQYEKVIDDRNRHEILYHYHLFKDRFKKVTKVVFGVEKEFVERYEDAPFNTIKKSATIVKEDKGSFAADLVNQYKRNLEIRN